MNHALQRRFVAYMIGIGYRQASARRYAYLMAQATREGAERITMNPAYVASAKAWLAFPGRAEDATVSKTADALLNVHQAMANRVQRRTAAGRKALARSIDDDGWTRLLAIVDRDASPESAVIAVIMRTALRIGDVLGVTRRDLELGAKTGVLELDAKGGKRRRLPWQGAPHAWATLLDFMRQAKAENVAGLLMGTLTAPTDSSHGAYRRVDDALKTFGETAEVEGRVHLHRLRRTVAVQALRVTENLVAVQQLLGHESINTTTRYVDEARPDALADVQRRVQRKFGGDE